MSLPPFQFVVDDLGPALRRHIAALAGPTDADDLVQETLIAALRAYDTLPDDSNVRAWLWTIARNKVIDSYRTASRRPQTTSWRVAGGGELDIGTIDHGHQEHPDDDLWSMVRQLPEGQRFAVTLRFVDDLTYAQIAEMCGCSAGAARQRVHEALTSLRQKVSIDHD